MHWMHRGSSKHLCSTVMLLRIAIASAADSTARHGSLLHSVLQHPPSTVGRAAL